MTTTIAASERALDAQHTPPPQARRAIPPFLERLFAAGLLVPTGVDGLYGRSERFEMVAAQVDALVSTWHHAASAELLRFPPAMSRETLEQSGYWGNCPDQIGTVFSFCGDDSKHRRLLACLDKQDDGWTDDLAPTRLSMTPAACYPVYPVMAARGALPADGKLMDILSYCFRHEPSVDPERMQLFRQREYVRLGSPEQVRDFRESCIEFAAQLADSLGLPASIEVANDPFFGRAGKLMADSQRAQALKFELLVPAINPSKPTACASFNYHMDRFGSIWDIRTADGGVAHTGCVGFGLERFTLSLFAVHGLDIDAWPAAVRDVLNAAAAQPRRAGRP